MQIVFTDLQGDRIRGSVSGHGWIGTVAVFMVNARGRSYLVDKATRREFTKREWKADARSQ